MLITLCGKEFLIEKNLVRRQSIAPNTMLSWETN